MPTLSVAPSSDLDTSKSTKPVLFCFSHLRWSFVYQRPQHLLSRAAQQYTVHFFEEPIFETGVSPHLQSSVVSKGVQVHVPILPPDLREAEIIEAQKKLLDRCLTLVGPVTLAWYYTPMALKFSAHLDFPVCVYDCMDELSAFAGAPREMRQLEKSLFAKCDFVFTGGNALYDSKRRFHDQVSAFPSSVDVSHFTPARNRSMTAPEDMKSIPHPRIGYVGVIDERIDLQLIKDTAAAKPNWNFCMIGPVAKIDPASLPQGPNIHWLGIRSYAELPAYLSQFDVAWMPFALNESTRYISPTKTPEFLAAGLPVVSTPVPDVVRSWGSIGLTSIASSVSETVAAIARNIGRACDAKFIGRVDVELASLSWDDTWLRMSSIIGRKMKTRTASVFKPRELVSAPVSQAAVVSDV